MPHPGPTSLRQRKHPKTGENLNLDSIPWQTVHKTMNRIAREKKYLDPSILLEEEDRCWKLQIPYNDSMIRMEVRFPEYYPFHAPYIWIQPDILSKLSVCHGNGSLCMSHLLGEWNAVSTIPKLIEQILTMLKASNQSQAHTLSDTQDHSPSTYPQLQENIQE